MYEGAVQDLIDELGRLPGVGPKSAQRIAFHLLACEQEDVQRLVESLAELPQRRIRANTRARRMRHRDARLLEPLGKQLLVKLGGENRGETWL